MTTDRLKAQKQELIFNTTVVMILWHFLPKLFENQVLKKVLLARSQL